MTPHQLHTLDRLSVQDEYPLLAAERQAIRAILAERAEWLTKTREAFAAIGGQRPQRAADILEDMIARANGGP
jgi:shikimate kinase